MRLRLITFGRGVVLFILGVALGTALFLKSWINPVTLHQQVVGALQSMIEARFEIDPDQIEIDLQHGLVIRNFTIHYPNTPLSPYSGEAVSAEEIVVTINPEELLAGRVNVQQVDIYGLHLNLRRDPSRGGLPGLPGILREADPDAAGEDVPPPYVLIHPGTRGTRILLHDDGPIGGTDPFPQILNADRPLAFWCTHAEIRPVTDGVKFRAEFEGDRLRSGTIDIHNNKDLRQLDIDVHLDDLSVEREDFAALSDAARGRLPPVRASGSATLRAHARFGYDEPILRELTGECTLKNLEGSFGNIFTGEAHDYPFRFQNGKAKLDVDWPIARIANFRAEYVSPEGEIGEIRSKLLVDLGLGPAFPLVDFELRATHLVGGVIDMRRMLQPVVIEHAVDPFRVAGVFDLDIDVERMPAMPEKFRLEARFTDATATFAGHLDKEARRRFGFDYPLQNGTGRMTFESNLVNSHGRHDVLRLIDVHGSRPVLDPDPGEPLEVDVRVRGDIILYEVPEEDPAIHANVRIEAQNIPIDERLENAFRRGGLAVPYAGLNVDGWVHRLTIDILMDGWRDALPHAIYTADVVDCRMVFDQFPLPVESIYGRIVKYDRDPAGSADGIVELRGLQGRLHGGGRVAASGRVRIAPDGTQHRTIEIASRELPLGPALAEAIARGAASDSVIVPLWRRLSPSGFIGATVRVVDDEATIGIQLRGHAHIAGYGDVVCPIRDLKGDLEIHGTGVHIERLLGRLGDATIWLAGDLAGDGRVDLSASIDNLRFTPQVRDLIGGFSPEFRDLLRTLALREGSHTNLALTVKRPDSDSEPHYEAVLSDVDLRTSIRNLPIEVSGGPIHLLGTRVRARDLRIHAADATVLVTEAELPRALDGHGWLVLDADDLHPEHHLRRILGKGFAQSLGPDIRVHLKDFRIEFNRGDRRVLLSGAIDMRRDRVSEGESNSLEPTGLLGLSPITLRLPRVAGEPIRLSGVLEYQSVNLNLPIPIGDLSGELLIADGTLSDNLRFTGAVRHGAATVFGRRLQNTSVNVEFGPVLFRLHDMEAKFYGGDLVGDAEVHFEEPGGFRVDLRLKNVNLAEFLKEDGVGGDEYSGRVNAALRLRSPSSAVRHMRGRAEIRVTEGKLLEIPGLRSVLGVLGRVAPFGESPRFKDAAIDMDIEGESLIVERLHLSTAVNDIYGYGRMTIYGDLDLLVFPQVTRVIDLPRIVNVPFLSAIGNAWFKTVNELRIEGTIDSPALRRRALPFLKKEPRSFTQSPHANSPRRARPRVLPN